MRRWGCPPWARRGGAVGPAVPARSVSAAAPRRRKGRRAMAAAAGPGRAPLRGMDRTTAAGGGAGGTIVGEGGRDGTTAAGGGRCHCRGVAVSLRGGAKPPRCQVMGDAAGSDGWRGAEPLTLWLPWRCCWLSLCSCFCPVSSPGTIKSSPGMTETSRGEGVRRLSITQPVAVAAGTACP